LEAGATGYVLKQAADTELVVAIRAVQRGEIFLYPVFTRVLLEDWAQNRETDDHRSDRAQPDSYELLSPREKEVLRLVALGYTSRQIAERLYLSVKTVGTYRARLMAKLDLKGRPALVRYALRKGLLDDVATSNQKQAHLAVPNGSPLEGLTL
jgi:two-component system response regulator NreC